MAESESTTTEVVTTETTVQQPDKIDEDYKWLTDRLDALTAANNETRTVMIAQLEAMREANQNSLSESKTLIHSLTEMLTAQSQTLTAIAAASTLSPLTPQISTNSSPMVEPKATVPEAVTVENVVVEATPGPNAESGRAKRKRL